MTPNGETKRERGTRTGAWRAYHRLHPDARKGDFELGWYKAETCDLITRLAELEKKP